MNKDQILNLFNQRKTSMSLSNLIIFCKNAGLKTYSYGKDCYFVGVDNTIFVLKKEKNEVTIGRSKTPYEELFGKSKLCKLYK